MRILIVYGSVHGQTRKIVDYVANRLIAEGQSLEVHDAARIPVGLDLADFDSVVVASPIRMGAYAPSVVRFARNHRQALTRMPSAFLSVSLAAANTANREMAAAELAKRVDMFSKKTGWTPARVEHVAGALAYARYGFVTRWIMRRIANSHGQETDTSRDHEYTDWTALGRFADSLVGVSESRALAA